MSAALLRLQIERSLAHRFPAALSPAPRALETTPTGIGAVDDLLDGGLPAGAITEIAGAESSGRTSLALTFVARQTREGRACAWVDAGDAFDPESAAASGVRLRQLLWVRCGGGEEAAEKRVGRRTGGKEAAQSGQIGGQIVNEDGLRDSHPGLKPTDFARLMRGLKPPPPSEENDFAACEGRTFQQKEFSAGAKARSSMNWLYGPTEVVPLLQSCEQSGISAAGEAPGRKKPWPRLEQAIRATDLLLQAGGFAAIVMDLAGTAPEHAIRIPLATWFRFRQAAARSRCSLVVLGRAAYAQSSAAAVLECAPLATRDKGGIVLDGFTFSLRRSRGDVSFRSAGAGRKPPESAWPADCTWNAEKRA